MFNNHWVKNHSFEQWVAGVPNNYSQQLTNTTAIQLQREHHKGHPQRLVIPPQSLRGLDYIREGRNSYRAELAAAAVADEWRIWPFGGDQEVDFSAAMLGPFRIILGVNDTINFNEGGGPFAATLTPGYYTTLTLAVMLKAQMEAVGGGTYAWTRHPTTGLWTVVESVVGTLNISWTTSNAARLLGFTADDAGAVTYTGDVASPQGGTPWQAVELGQLWSFVAWMRGNVADQQVRFRFVLLDEEFTVGLWWHADTSRWIPVDNVVLREIGPRWQSSGSGMMSIPAAHPYMMWQVSNQTAGAQVVDIDGFRYVEGTRQFG